MPLGSKINDSRPDLRVLIAAPFYADDGVYLRSACTSGHIREIADSKKQIWLYYLPIYLVSTGLPNTCRVGLVGTERKGAVIA